MLRLSAAALLLTLCAASASAQIFGSNKEFVQLETQVQQLQDSVARLQQSNDERMGVLKDLVQQSADSVNRLSLNMDTLQKQLAAQQNTEGTRVDQISGQVQALNDSLDEIKARMARLEKAVADVQNQTQNINTTLQNQTQSQPQPQAQGPQPAQTAPVVQTPASPPSGQQSSLATPPAPRYRSSLPPNGSSAPPVEDLYKAAIGDYMAAKYPIATSEFGDVIKSYPDHALAGNSYYYLGEIEYRAGTYSAATRDYDRVLEQFPDSSKIPAAHLHKGEALIEVKQNDAAIREFRALIQRFPNSPEATQARSRLSGMGVPVRPRNP